MIPLLIAGVLVAALGAYWVLMSPYSQAFGNYPYRGDASERVVALTFDDGPNEPYTSQIVEYLNSRNIRATFFQVGHCVERSPETTARIDASGHVIGNHSLTHRFSTYLRPARFEREVQQTQEILRRTLGRTPALVRSPWLWRQPMMLRMLRGNLLQPVAGVFCHAFEVFQIDATKIARRAVAKTRPIFVASICNTSNAWQNTPATGWSRFHGGQTPAGTGLFRELTVPAPHRTAPPTRRPVTLGAAHPSVTESPSKPPKALSVRLT